MIFNMKKIGISALVAISLLCASPMQASAASLGDIVDVLDDILDQAETIADAAEAIIENGNFEDLAPLVADAQQIIDLLEQVETISFNVETVLDDFEEVFPDNFDEFDIFETVTSINTANESTRESVERVLELGASTVQDQLTTSVRTQAIRSVGTVAGPAAALQALVNLQSEQIGQLSSLQTLLVAQSRILGLQATQTENARKRAIRLREIDDPTVFATDEPIDILFGSALD